MRGAPALFMLPFTPSDTCELDSNMPLPLTEAHTLDLEVLRQFRVIFRSVRKHFQQIEKSVGISGSQLWAVSVIAEQPGIRVTELAKSMSIHQTTASNLVEKLCELDFIYRERSNTDSRVIQLFPTESGKKRLDSAPGPVRGLLPDALGKLRYTTLVALNNNLSELLTQMDALEPQSEDVPLADIE